MLFDFICICSCAFSWFFIKKFDQNFRKYISSLNKNYLVIYVESLTNSLFIFFDKALINGIQSYVYKLIINVAVDLDVIPDPHHLCSLIIESLSMMNSAGSEKNISCFRGLIFGVEHKRP